MEAGERRVAGVSARSSPFEDGLGPALVYFGFRAAAWLAEHVPVRMGDRLARIGGRVAFRVAARKRSIVRRNLARVVGEGPHLDAVVRRAFDSYARYWLETFRLGRYSPRDLLAMVDCDGLDALESALAQGRGVVVATAHFGFYDLAVAWIGANGYPLATVGEVLRPRALFEWFAAQREVRGMRVIPAQPREEALRRQEEILGRGEGVALLSERNLGRRGVWVEFFGERTTFPVGPALLVTRTGAPLLSGAIYQKGDRYQLDFEAIAYERQGEERADVASIAQRIAVAVEAMVRKAPEQWHLFSTNWPSDEPHLPPRGG